MSENNLVCPRCESDQIEEKKSWILEGGKGEHIFRIHLYQCRRCKKFFRKSIKLK